MANSRYQSQAPRSLEESHTTFSTNGSSRAAQFQTITALFSENTSQQIWANWFSQRCWWTWVKLSPSTGKAACCPLLHRRNPEAPLPPLPALENVAYLPHSSNSTSIFPCYFTPLHCHQKNDKGKNNYKDEGLHPHSRINQDRGLAKQNRSKPPNISLPSSLNRIISLLPMGAKRSHGCKPVVCLKMSFNTTVHQCYLLKPKQRRLCLLSSQEQLNHKTKIFRFIISLLFCAYKSLKRWEAENRYIGLL